jgi:hypothetical protein
LENKRAEQVMPGGEGWHQWEGRGNGESGQKDEYSAKTMNICKINAKMIPVETTPGMRWWEG